MKKEKQLLLEEVKEQIEKSGSFIVTGYQNLTGEKAFEFRRVLDKTGGYFEVIRKRLLIEAARQIGVEFKAEELPGHVGVILGSVDPLEATKAIATFANENENTLTLLGGFIDQQKVSQKDAQRLATLPGKEELRAQIIGLFVAPMTGVLGTMEAVLGDVVSCIDSKAKQS